MFKHLDHILLHPESTIREVMERIDQTAVWTDGGIGLIVDQDHRLLGIVTDGDIRRALLSKYTLDMPVKKIMVSDPVVAHLQSSSHQLLRLFDKRIKQVPIVDDKRRVVDLFLYNQFSVLRSREHGMLRAKVPMRISFAGGGTDFTCYFKNGGSAVINATIDRYAQAMLLQRNDSKIILHSLDFNQKLLLNSLDDIEYDGQLDLLKAVIRIVKPEVGFDLYTHSEVPVGSGMGGSSAIAVAVVGLLYTLKKGQLDAYQIADLAYQAERIELGVSGGWQDQYASTFGGFNFVEFEPNDVIVNTLQLDDFVLNELESNMLLCFTGQTRNSGEIHAKVLKSSKKTPTANLEMSSKMLNLVDAVRKALLKGNLAEFGRLLDSAWQEKKRQSQKSITNNQIEHLYATAKKNGAIGGKLLGAGKGGFLLFFCDPVRRHLVQQSLEKEGASVSAFKFDHRGLRVWRSPVYGEMENVSCKP